MLKSYRICLLGIVLCDIVVLDMSQNLKFLNKV